MSGLWKEDIRLWRKQGNDIAKEMGLAVLGKLPVITKYAELADEGRFDEVDTTYVNQAALQIMNLQ